MRILVTGANGFVGRHLIAELLKSGASVTASVRGPAAARDLRIALGDAAFAALKLVETGDVGPVTDWSTPLEGIHTVVHLAGRAHLEGRRSGGAHDRINREGTARLGAQAAQAGVGHFIFVSSVHAVASRAVDCIDEKTPCSPDTAYGVSKLLAEKALLEVAAAARMKVTILRPTLVYGPENRANFARLIRLVRSGVPVPFASIQNRRSLIYVGNLASAIAAAARTTPARSGVYLLSDGKDVSTPQLVREIAAAGGRPCRMFPLPAALLHAAAALPIADALRRLRESLAVDPAFFRETFSWSPPYSFEAGIRAAVAATADAENPWKRLLDLAMTSIALAAVFPALLLTAILIKSTSSGPVLHASERVGRDNRIFRMYKFRTMKISTPDVATHLLNDPQRYLTPIGHFLRRTSIDEIPQLFNVLIGDMSLVGPRPALHNQYDLIRMRTERGIHRLKPGITGFAQISGRDTIDIPQKVKFDKYYLDHRRLSLDFKILLRTIWQAFSGKDVSH